MAGNFWKSSHYEQWILEKHDLLRERGEDLKILAEEEYQKIMIFFVNFIQAIGQDKNLSDKPHTSDKNQSSVRMQVIATACVYFRRFYARRSFKDVDPFLLAPTCIWLASKVEETGVLSTTKLLSAVQNALKKWPSLNQELVIRQQLLHEAEFCILEIMDCCLIVYHPYRPLSQMAQEMKASGIPKVDEIYQDAWKICNDSLRSDVALLYAPHQIALACIMSSCVINRREDDEQLKNWISEMAVDFEKITEIQQMIFNMYRVWRNFDESDQLLALLGKLPRPQAQIPSQSQQQPLSITNKT
ncbi:cyclin-C [Ditylenchus destructor]|uniref:Cyclin-C n=1 Tax=Ditylenchus destructor TaxID=166010 RepID=A0AAD4N9A9_9BILA|nr:cyclin-C [Ditylenchus destructor]